MSQQPAVECWPSLTTVAVAGPLSYKVEKTVEGVEDLPAVRRDKDGRPVQNPVQVKVHKRGTPVVWRSPDSGHRFSAVEPAKAALPGRHRTHGKEGFLSSHARQTVFHYEPLPAVRSPV